jgi:Pyridoxamine 5'-phosphate oxidase
MVEPRRRRPPFRDYGIPTDDEGMLAWHWAATRLGDARNYWVSTTRPDGRPHAMPVWGVWLDDGFFFGTGRSSAKARNLAANPAVVVHLESGDEVVILEGAADEVVDGELAERVNRSYASKYDWRADAGDPSPFYVVRPRRAYAWTEREFPRSATQFDF